jgi:hypothetical protein
MTSAPFSSKVLQALSAIALTVILIGSLLFIYYGLERLTQVTGQDLAIPGDEVGELEVVSTRQVRLQPIGILWIGIGIGFSLGALWLIKRINTLSNHKH